MTKRELYLEAKPHFGFRVLNKHGEAELGTYHIADFSWKEDAEFFIAQQIACEKATTAFSDLDLQSMMRDPKYWRDQDPKFIERVKEGFKKLYGDK